MQEFPDAIAVYRSGSGRRVEFRLQDIEKLISHGAAQILGNESVEGLKLLVNFRRDPVSGSVTGANVIVEEESEWPSRKS